MDDLEASIKSDGEVGNAEGGSPSGKTFCRNKHIEYIISLQKRKNDFEDCVVEHMRVSGMYWGLTALALMDSLESVEAELAIDYVLQCQTVEGGFGGCPGQDAHLLYTLSALQLLIIFDSLGSLPDRRKTAEWIAKLQNSDGSFGGDKWGEVDTRYTYCALYALSILNELSLIDINSAVRFVNECCNFDAGYGCVPGAESHAGQVFCCVGALAIADALDCIDRDLLGSWLCERQTPEGGLNGRPEKKPDVCYSWWVLSSLSVLGGLSWINREQLCKFILKSQDEDAGGIADRPGDVADVYHTFFGVAGLSLLGCFNLQRVDPVFALPTDVVKRAGLRDFSVHL